jgi:hypothetical protein
MCEGCATALQALQELAKAAAACDVVSCPWWQEVINNARLFDSHLTLGQRRLPVPERIVAFVL